MLDGNGLVILDTDVWSLLYGPRRTADPRVRGWRDLISGSTVVIAAQTRAEVLAGVYSSNWGQQRRGAVLIQLERTATIPVDERVIEQYAQLTGQLQEHRSRPSRQDSLCRSMGGGDGHGAGGTSVGSGRHLSWCPWAPASRFAGQRGVTGGQQR